MMDHLFTGSLEDVAPELCSNLQRDRTSITGPLALLVDKTRTEVNYYVHRATKVNTWY